MSYSIEIVPSAEKEYLRLPEPVKTQVRNNFF